MTDEEVIAQKSKTLYEQLQAVYKQEAQMASDTYILELQKKLQNAQLAVSGMNQTIAATANYNPVVTMSANMSALEAKMDRLVVLAEEYYPQMAEGADIILDGDSVATKVTEKVSQNLASSLNYSR